MLADAGVAPRSPRAQALDSPARYHLAVITLFYILPLVVMLVAYGVISLTLWRCTVPGYEAHGANLRHLQAKKVNSGVREGAGGGAGSLAPASGTRYKGLAPGCSSRYPFRARPLEGAAEDRLHL